MLLPVSLRHCATLSAYSGPTLLSVITASFLPDISSFVTFSASFEKSFSILGKKWNGLIIDVLLERGPQRFGELKEKIPMLSDRVLVERLKELEAEGIITKAVRCGEGNRLEYFLTEKGEDHARLLPVVVVAEGVADRIDGALIHGFDDHAVRSFLFPRFPLQLEEANSMALKKLPWQPWREMILI